MAVFSALFQAIKKLMKAHFDVENDKYTTPAIEEAEIERIFIIHHTHRIEKEHCKKAFVVTLKMAAGMGVSPDEIPIEFHTRPPSGPLSECSCTDQTQVYSEEELERRLSPYVLEMVQKMEESRREELRSSDPLRGSSDSRRGSGEELFELANKLNMIAKGQTVAW